MRIISGDQAIDRSHFARMWAERNCDRVHVFGDGHVYDRAARRADIRTNIRVQRSAIAYANANASRVRWVTA